VALIGSWASVSTATSIASPSTDEGENAMTTSSITGGARAPRQPSGADLASLGPSDSSDSGSDSLGTRNRQALAGDSDSTGTGEDPLSEGWLVQGCDILPDHLVRLAGSAGQPAAQGVEQALDDPNLIDTTADVTELAQDEADAQDLDGFSADDDRPDVGALPGHRGIQ
jgi:hypothetical protein